MNIRQLKEFIYLHQIAFHKKRLTNEFDVEVTHKSKKTQNKKVLGDHLKVSSDIFGNQIELIRSEFLFGIRKIQVFFVLQGQ